MDPGAKSAAIAAALILGGFAFVAYFLPTIMLWVGSYSTIAAGVVAVLFVGAFFLLFWLRGRSQNREGQ